MDNSSYAPLSDACGKMLGDKTYEKRKLAAQEIEKMIIDANNNNNHQQIKRLIEVFIKQFASSKDVNKRKGGLIALAATSIALGKDSEKYISDLVNPILNCLLDVDTRVRYFAAESLYNVVKICRGAIIPLFPDVFTSLSRLVTDADTSVKNASELLDRLLKDIVTESSQTFDLTSFIPLLRDRVYTKNSFGRQFVISWISILNAVPEINMIHFLPEILDGLFQMLEDNMSEIQKMCETLLSHFIKSIKHDPAAADMPSMINILIGHAQANNELVQNIAIGWIRDFVHLSGPKMLAYTSGIFTAILPCLAYEGESKKQTKECALAVNKLMLDLVSDGDKSKNLKNIDLDSVMEVLKQYLVHSSVNTKVAVLKWIHHLFISHNIQDEMSKHANNLFPVLLGILKDNSDEVVLQGLEVLAEIVKSTKEQDTDFNQEKYREFLESLLKLFIDDKLFLDHRGTLIIRQLCVLLNAEFIYRTFAEILCEKVDNKFASLMVRTLNMILFTTSELFDLRKSLRNITDPKSAKLFQILYHSWAHCPVSTVSLCLLAQCYQHVSDLVAIFGNLEITVDFLVEIDKLVQLIESPIFASLRLTLVSHHKGNQIEGQYLSQALYGILMLIPQTEAFHLLKNRLQCIPNFQRVPVDKISNMDSVEKRSGIKFEALLVYFEEIQQAHHQQRLAQRRMNNIYHLWD